MNRPLLVKEVYHIKKKPKYRIVFEFLNLMTLSEDWHFLCHLDPMFVEIEDVEGYVKEEVGEIQ